MPSYSSKPWTVELGERVRDRWLLKTAGLTAGISVFMAVYFHLLHHPSGPVFEMPLTAFDRWIPFRPAWVLVYFTLWFYVGFGPGLQRGLPALARYGAWIGAMCGTGLLCFQIWPTRMAQVTAEAGDFPGYSMLRGLDATGNACPSMHVAAAVFTLVRVDAILCFARSPAALRLFNAVWCTAIVYSTMATRQHGFWDVAGGAALGTVFALASLVKAKP